MEISTKKSKLINGKVVLYFAPERIQRKRLAIMKNCAKKNGYLVNEVFSDEVTHIISEFDEEEQVIRSLKINIDDWFLIKRPKIVNTKWFAECIKEGKIIKRHHHRLKVVQQRNENKTEPVIFSQYACQRINPLNHYNHHLTESLEILAEEAELRDDLRNAGRAIAFRKAASVLKSLKNKITNVREVKNLKDIGKHSQNVIREILEEGKCCEVTELSNSEWFITVKLFNSIYGVGPKTANKWYNMGLRTIEDIISSDLIQCRDKRINYGLAFHKDLSTPISKVEADVITELIRKEVTDILPDVILCLTGGFRRGKVSGHDVDMLLSHPIEGKEVGLLITLLDRLKEKGCILTANIERSLEKDPKQFSKFNTMDGFEKSFLIFKDYVTRNKTHCTEITKEYDDLPSLCKIANESRNWIARRVDIVICPFSQFAFALVGWTGNKQFNRSLRDYAKKEKNMRLTSHIFYDFTNNLSIPASTEEEIFTHLDLPYYEPHNRNA